MISIITDNQLTNWDKQRRTTFVNSLWGMRNLCLVGTANKDGQLNLAIFNSLVHIGANPAMAAIMIRPDSVDRHTLQNIRATRCFTVNNILPGFHDKAHQTSARYESGVSEFDATGLTPLLRDGFLAPFVKESSVQLAFTLQQEVPITANGTLMVVGLLQSAFLDDSLIGNDGFVDHLAAGTIHGVGIDAYFSSTPIGRLTYAKPNITPTVIDKS